MPEGRSNVQAPVRITLTAEQQALVRRALGKSIVSLGIEPNETGAGWLYSAGNNQFWLLKHSDPESYRAARRKLKPRIDPRRARFRLRIGKSRIHRFGVFAEERIPARRNVIDYIGELVNPVESHRRNKNAKVKYVIRLAPVARSAANEWSGLEIADYKEEVLQQ